MPPILKFELPDGHDIDRLIRELSQDYGIKKEPPRDTGFVIYDTFDWRLFNKSLFLYSSGNKLFLRKPLQTKIVHSHEFSTLPTFIDDIPHGGLKEALAPIIKARALLRLVEGYGRSTPFRILNPDKKTVVRLIYEEFRLSPKKDAPALATHLGAESVKGYPKHYRNLTQRLRQAGFKISRKDVCLKALESVDKQPGDYSAKINLKLDPSTRSEEATKAILRFLWQIIKINQAHLAKDIDTEFLHDFRVAIRRTRSALGQIKGVFPLQTTERFKKDFAFAGKLSNRLRDLDVYLLKQNTYKAMLPAALRDDIDPFFVYLGEKRSQVFQEVIRSLASKTYQQIANDWEVFLKSAPDDSPEAANARVPIAVLARKRVFKKYRTIIKNSREVLENTEDEALHVLRIECKKLRYLMEFFSSLFPRAKMNALIGQLRKLQDNLGDFHDICVQQEYLLNITDELPIIDRQSKKALVAIGSLIETLAGEKRIVKDAFAETFTEFASPENSRLFRKLFAKK